MPMNYIVSQTIIHPLPTWLVHPPGLVMIFYWSVDWGYFVGENIWCIYKYLKCDFTKKKQCFFFVLMPLVSSINAAAPLS